MTAAVLFLAGMFALAVIAAAVLAVPDWLAARGVDTEARLAPYGWHDKPKPAREDCELGPAEEETAELLLEQVWPR